MKKRRILTVREVLAAGLKARGRIARTAAQPKAPPSQSAPYTGRIRITHYDSEHPEGYDGGKVTTEDLEKILSTYQTPQSPPTPAELMHFRKHIAAVEAARTLVSNLGAKHAPMCSEDNGSFGCGLFEVEDLENILAARDVNSPPHENDLIRITVFSSEHPEGYDGGGVTPEELEKVLNATQQRAPSPAELVHFRKHIAADDEARVALKKAANNE